MKKVLDFCLKNSSSNQKQDNKFCVNENGNKKCNINKKKHILCALFK